jgi:DNA polymerase-1
VRVALIDADILAYQASSSAEQPVDWGEGMWTLHSFEDDAIALFESLITRIQDATEASKVVLCFSDKSNWRKIVLPTYKSNRVGTRKPMLLRFLRDYAAQKYDIREVATLEGDDVIGLNATGKNAERYIICSLDKDLKTIPGSHYNFGKDEFFEITEEEADYWHMIQTLTGDTTDGYSGCPGVGPKTAEKILSGGGPMWDKVVAAYAKAGFGEEEALTQARVARILRHGDYDFENNQVRLWTPTTLN